MKKILSLLLVLCMLLSLAACKGPDVDPTGDSNPTNATDPVVEKFDTVDSYTVNYGSVAGGTITMNPNTATGGGEVSYDLFSGVSGKDYTDSEVYTLNDYISGTTNMNWDPLNWETSDDSYVLGYISDSLVTFALNATKDGWAIEFSLATGYEDVTADYVGSFGVVEGDYGKAWKFTLNPDACWEDGTPITADTYIYTAMEQLSPLMNNRRADSLYAGNAAIYGAKNYYYQGKTAWFAASDSYSEYSDTLDSELIFSLAAPSADRNCEAYMRTSMGFPSSYDAAACAAYLITNYLADTAFTADAAAAMEGKTFAEIKADETLKAAWDALIGWWQTDPNEELHFFVTEGTFGAYSWDDVGFLKTGEYEIVMIVTTAIESPNYYVPYMLGSATLVYPSLWESCKTYYDADGNTVSADSDKVASITTKYGTSLDTTMSYGPYKLTYFELDKQITFERNEKWYGYHDGKHLGQYQTDIISCTVISEHSTALLAFLSGEIDSVSLMQEDMPTYGTSDYVRYNPQSYTTKLSFNTNFDSLYSRGTGSQILVNKTFREAFSLALNSAEFASSFTTGSAGYGLLNYLYIFDPFSGATYRDTDAAKGALVDLYGMTYGEEGDYETLDEAYEAITGYDLDAAKALMVQAYEECTTEGLYDGVSAIELQINVYNTEDIYVQMVNYFQSCLDKATAGSGFEGKITMKLVADDDYYNTMYSGNTDIIFTTWGGAASTPYTMLYQCYCDAADGSKNQMEYGFDTSKIPVTININGVDYTSDLQTWSKWACNYGEEDGVVITGTDGSTLAGFNTYDPESRANAFARLEYAYLSYFTTIPLYYRASAFLVGQQGNYAVDASLDLIGFGGIQFYTYNYTDAQWAEVAGSLTY